MRSSHGPSPRTEPLRRPPARRRALRRATVSVAGGAVVLAGVAMLVLPGPGLLTMAIGLEILGREFAWAARLSHDVRARLGAAGRTVGRGMRRTARPWAKPGLRSAPCP